MANAVIILGKSGTGKSSSIKTLNPKDTIILNVLGKKLPFKGSSSLYNKDNKKDKRCSFTSKWTHISTPLSLP